MARAKRRDRRSVQPQGSPASAAGNGQIQRACRYWPAWATLLAALALGLAGDLLTKHYAFAALLERPGHAVEVIPGVLNLSLIHI